MGHLKKGAAGHLAKNAAGHLVHCGCFGISITFTGIDASICSGLCWANPSSRVGESRKVLFYSGAIDGTYSIDVNKDRDAGGTCNITIRLGSTVTVREYSAAADCSGAYSDVAYPILAVCSYFLSTGNIVDLVVTAAAPAMAYSVYTGNNLTFGVPHADTHTCGTSFNSDTQWPASDGGIATVEKG